MNISNLTVAITRTHSQCRQHYLHRTVSKLGPTPTGSTSAPCATISTWPQPCLTPLHNTVQCNTLRELLPKSRPYLPSQFKPTKTENPAKNTHAYISRSLSIIKPKATAPRIKIAVCNQSHNAQQRGRRVTRSNIQNLKGKKIKKI
jgi:hypothetical protein